MSTKEVIQFIKDTFSGEGILKFFKVFSDILQHSRTRDMMYLAKDVARDMTLRYQIEDADKATEIIDKISQDLNKTYSKLLSESYDEERKCFIPDIETLSEEEAKELKSLLAKSISEIDTKLSSGGR